MATAPISYQDSPLQLIAFTDVEDERFGAPGTPERTEYEDRVTLELLSQSIREYRLRNHLTRTSSASASAYKSPKSASWSATLPMSPSTPCAASSKP